MIIVVEGIDRVGKSTLIEKIHKELDYDVLNGKIRHELDKSTAQMVQNERIFAQLDIFKLCSDKFIVVDRFHLSQYVYGIVERNNIDTSMWTVDEELAKLGALLILVDPTDIAWSSEKHGKSLYDHQQIFNAAYETSKMKKFRINFNEFDTLKNKMHEILIGGNDNGDQS